MSLERFSDNIVSSVVSPCASCHHKNIRNDTCKAFKDGIPLNILTGRHSHRKAYPGDNGVLYTKKG